MSAPVVIITGASRGIGASAARLAAHLGACVTLAGRSEAALRDEAGKIQAAGGQALVVTADVSQEADCQAVAQQTLARFGRIDALVNNAGDIEPIRPAAEADPEAWKQNWSVNVLGTVMMLKHALPALRQSAGRVIIISSGASENPIPGWGPYCAAKAALNHLTRVLALEEPGITILALRPGIVDTDMQSVIRSKGPGRMGQRSYEWLAGLHEQGLLLPPDAPGKAIAVLAWAAPHEWSGQSLQWDDPRVRELALTVWKE